MNTSAMQSQAAPVLFAEQERLPQIVGFLGGETAMSRRIENKLDVHNLIKSGFPFDVLRFLMNSIPALRDPDFMQKAIGMSVRTSQRKNADGAVLTAEQSSKTWNFAEVMTQAEAVFGTKEDAIKWLNEPALGLDGERPIDLLSTSAGHDLVTDLLTRMEFGVYA